jgi:hypothetical protein
MEMSWALGSKSESGIEDRCLKSMAGAIAIIPVASLLYPCKLLAMSHAARLCVSIAPLRVAFVFLNCRKAQLATALIDNARIGPTGTAWKFIGGTEDFGIVAVGTAASFRS